MKTCLYRNTNVYNILAWFLMLSAFSYSVMRAYSVSINGDEAVTHYISLGSFLDILTYRFVIPNNHLLNTFLIKIFISLFGLSEFAMRIPALIGHCLYLVGVYKILGTFLRKKLFLSGMFLLLFNPYVIRMFSAARGFALGLGFLTLGIYFFIMSIKNDRTDVKSYKKNIALASWMLALATLSILSFFNVYISLIILLAGFEFIKYVSSKKEKESYIYTFKCFFKKIIPLIFPCLLVLVIYALPVYKLIKLDQFYGGVKGFWADTVTSLIRASLYGKYMYHNFHLLILLIKVLIIVVLFVASALLLYKWFTKQEFRLIDKYLLGMLTLLLTCSFSVVLQWYLLNITYVTERAGVYFIPMFLILFSIIGGYGSVITNKFIRISTHWFFYLLVLVSLIHFYNCANFSYYYFLGPPVDSVKTVMSYLEEINKGRDLEDNSISIGMNHSFVLSVDFYKEKNKLSWLKWAVWTGPDGKFDYYLLGKNKKFSWGLGKNQSVAKNLKIVERYGLKIIKEYSTGLFLAIPENRCEEQDATTSIKPPYYDDRTEGEGFMVRFVAKELTWVKITVDNKYPFEIMLRADESATWFATESMKVRIENAERASLFFNDIPLRVPDQHGKPLYLKFPEAAEKLKLF